MTIAFIFPGQGSQAVGMGAALADAYPSARSVFAEVDEALGQDLSHLMRNGPAEELTQTENAQPALMAVSMAVVRVLESEWNVRVADAAACVAGHSLGEYSALAAAGTFSLSDAARLLKTRGRAMQSAAPAGTGAMAALLGLDYADAAKVAEDAAEGDVCQAANDNSPGQVVVSGTKAAVGRAIEIAKARGAKRAMLLSVSAPFHCALMEPAARVMAEALSNTPMREPVAPLYANVTAAPITDTEHIRAHLVEQVTGTVRWRESMAAMAASGVHLFYELGSGKVLTGLVKRNVTNATGMAAETPDEIAAMAAVLKQGA